MISRENEVLVYVSSLLIKVHKYNCYYQIENMICIQTEKCSKCILFKVGSCKKELLNLEVLRSRVNEFINVFRLELILRKSNYSYHVIEYVICKNFKECTGCPFLDYNKKCKRLHLKIITTKGVSIAAICDSN